MSCSPNHPWDHLPLDVTFSGLLRVLIEGGLLFLAGKSIQTALGLKNLYFWKKVYDYHLHLQEHTIWVSFSLDSQPNLSEPTIIAPVKCILLWLPRGPRGPDSGSAHL